MRRNIREDIKNLENEILHIENKILGNLRVANNDAINKLFNQLESDLKYLSILANGAPIDKKEDRKIMDFLRIHYDYMKKLCVPA